jgi:hypothetical protein
MRTASVLVGVAALLLVACAAPPDASPSPSASTAPSETPADVESTSPTPSPQPAATHRVADAVDEELREELLAMLVEDQAVRTGVAPPGDDRTPEELFAAWDAVDAANTARMAEILDEHGWPGWSLVGRDGSEAAWALVQHADANLEVQKLGLLLLEAAVEADDASRGDLAYLTDRVRVAEGQPQLYGTQLEVAPDGEIVPRTPIEDEANLDARRAAAGLSTWAEYLEEFRAFLEEEPSPSP